MRIPFLLFVIFFNTITFGQSWNPVQLGTLTIHAAQCVDSSTIYLGGSSFFKSADTGSTWSSIPMVDNFTVPIPSVIHDIHFFDPLTGLATGYAPISAAYQIYLTTNGGISWTYVYQNTIGSGTLMLHDLAFNGSTTGLAVGSGGHITRTTNGGSSWTAVSSGTTTTLKGAAFASGSIAVAVGNGVILRSTDGGSNWSTSTTVYDLSSVEFASGGIGYASGNIILKTTDYGVTWTPVNSINASDICVLNQDTAFIANNSAFVSYNAATYFGPQYGISPETYRDIDFYGDWLGALVGDSGKVYITKTGGDHIQQNDATVFDFEPWPATLCPGTYPVKVRLRNAGLQPLTSATIHWKVGNVLQMPYTWTGNLLTDSVSAYIQIGSYTLSGGGKPAVAWTSMPNSQVDSYPANDSAFTIIQAEKLSGTYSIGGMSPDFATVTDAVYHLNTFGICGPVIFSIRDGNYLGNYTINPVNGASNVNSVTFESENQDSTLVMLSGIAGNIITLSGADHIHFRLITVNASNLSAILFQNGADSNSVRNCVLNGVASGTAANLSVINSSGTTSKSLLIENNRILYGSYGVNFNGTSANYAADVSIADNTFAFQKARGISLSYQSAIVIHRNRIDDTPSSVFDGIYFVNGNGAISISHNMVYVNEGHGLYLSGMACTPGNEGQVFNNFVRTGATASTHAAIYLLLSKNIQVFNNTLYKYGTLSNAATMLLYSADTINDQHVKIFNNIMHNAGSGYAFRISSAFMNASQSVAAKFYDLIGPNVYYSPAGSFNQHLGVNTTDLNSWRQLVLSDSLSFVADAQFLSPDDLHIYPQSVNYALEGKGISWPGLNDDIDLQPRLTLPDIGADEFDRPPFDLHLQIMDTGLVCMGNNPLHFRVANYGTSPVDSFKLNWQVNGVVQTPLTWNGTLLPNDTTPIFVSGTFSFSSGSYLAEAWASDPNGALDLSPYNDSVARTLQAGGLSGTYLVGTSPSAAYSSISAAVADLSTQGVCGPVLFDIEPGTYNEQVIIPAIAGVTNYKTITFRSLTGDSTDVEWTFASSLSSANYIVLLDGADYIRLERLTFLPAGSTYGTAIEFRSGADFNIIRNCQVLGNPSITNLIFSPNTIDNYNLITGNYIHSGQTALKFSGTFTNYEKGNIISDNYFFNSWFRSVDISYQASFRVEGNTVLNDTITNTALKGILINLSSGNCSVNNNSVRGNMLNGIQWDSHDGTQFSRGRVFNNMIQTGGHANGTAFTGHHLNYAELVNNTFYLDGLPSTSTDRTCYLRSISGRVYNNIFVNAGTGNAFYCFSYSLLEGSDHNIFHTNGNTLIAGGGFFQTLPNWQNATTFDQNSFEAPPAFVSSTDLHLGLYFSAFENGSSAFLNWVPKDIDGDVRAQLPTIGADETIPALHPSDAGIVKVLHPGVICPGPEPVKAVLRNFSDTVLTNVSIAWSVNNVAQPPFSWTGSLPPLAKDTVVLGSFIYSPSDTFNIKAWPELPNGNVDLAAINDTSVQVVRSLLAGTLTIGGSGSDYANFTDACSDLNNLGICGPVEFLASPGTYAGNQINLFDVAGTSSTNTITFRSSTGNNSDVQLTGGYIVLAHGVDYLTVRDMTLSGSGDAVEIKNGSHNFTLKNCSIVGGIYSPETVDNFIVIDSNHISTGFVFIKGPASLLESGVSFTNNIVQNSSGTRFDNIDSINVSHNTIENISPSSSTGIYIQNCNGKIQVNGNRVWGNFSRGIQFNSVDGSPSLPAEVINNAVRGAPYAPTSSYAGMEIAGDWINVINNSIDAGYWGLAFADCDNCISRNNTIKGINDWTYFVAGSSNFTSDYNNIYAPTSFNTFYYNGSMFTSLSAYQTATGQDLNSMMVDPQYVSSTDLSPGALQLKNAGTPIPSVTQDINFMPRHPITPYIGAYEVYNMPSGDLTDTSSCGQPILLSSSVLLSDTANPFTTYMWNTGDSTYSIIAPSSGLYWVTVTNPAGSLTDSVNVDVFPAPVVAATTNTDSLCVGACAQLSASVAGGTPGFTFAWLQPQGLSDIAISNPMACPAAMPVTYDVVVTDFNGCTDTSSVSIYPHEMPMIVLAADTAICTGDSAILWSNVAATSAIYSWSPSLTLTDPNNDTTVAFPDSTTRYQLLVTNYAGCSDSMEVQVVVNDLPVAFISLLSNAALVCNPPASSYQWFVDGSQIQGANTQSILAPQTGNYVVVVTDSNGCSASSAPYYFAFAGMPGVPVDARLTLFPNPGRNELSIVSSETLTGITVSIYNAAGKLVLEKDATLYPDGPFTIQTGTLASGFYLIRINNQSVNKNFRWIKQ